MRKSAKIISALSVAGLAVAAGSAFTASNTLPAIGTKGYGEATATGISIASVTFNPLSSDNSKLASIVFTSTTHNTTNNTVSMTLKNAGSTVSTYTTCSTEYATGVSTITCTTANNPLLNTFDTTGLTVL